MTSNTVHDLQSCDISYQV